MRGTDKHTGKPLDGIAHLRQSVTDILTTPLGSRVMRRDYGSRLFDLIDSPVSPDTAIDFTAAVAEALSRWEPRINVASVRVSSVAPGAVTLTLTGAVAATGTAYSQNLSISNSI